MKNVAEFPKAPEMVETLYNIFTRLDGNAEAFEPLPNGFFNVMVVSSVDGVSKKGNHMLTTVWQDVVTGRKAITYTMHNRPAYNDLKKVCAGDLYRVQHTGSGGFSSVSIVGEHMIEDFDNGMIILPNTPSKFTEGTKQSLFCFDIEVFKFDILIVLRDYFTKEWYVFRNDLEGFKEFYLKHRDSLFIGYNNGGYDNHVVRGYLQGKNPYTLSKVIIDSEDRRAIYKLYNTRKTTLFTMDLYMDNRRFSLKEHSAFMGIDIEETQVDFDIDRPLNDDEHIKNEFYCKNDVLATEKRLEQNISMLLAKVVLVATYNLDKTFVSMTNANLTAAILGAIKVPDRGDERAFYEMPEGFSITNEDVLENMTGELPAEISFKVDRRDVTIVLGEGGSHSAKSSYINTTDTMYHNDATSLHPSSMRLFDLESRNIPEDKQGIFSDIMDKRIQAKHNKKLTLDVKGVKVAGWVLDMGYKLPLNTTYGAMGAKFNQLYDARQRLLVCLVGQLGFFDLLEKLEPHATIVQTNTDAIDAIPFDDESHEEMKKVMKDWEARTGYQLDSEAYVEMFQRDVNNYIQRMEDDSVNVKGAIGLTRGLKISKAVVSNAFINYLLNGVDPAEYIDNCNDLRAYQIIGKTGRTFQHTVYEMPDGSYKKAQKVNRVFAVKPELDLPTVKVRKVKLITLDEQELDLSMLDGYVPDDIEETDESNNTADLVETLEQIIIDGETYEADSIQVVKGIMNEPDAYMVDNKAVGSGNVTIDMIDKAYYIEETYRQLEQWFGVHWRERVETARKQGNEKREPLPIKEYIKG